MNNKKCYLNIYDKCIVIENNDKLKDLYKEDPEKFIRDICSLCIKAYRLKNGLRYKHEFVGERIGVTL